MARLCSLPSSFGSLSFGVGTKGLEEPFSPSLPLRFLPFEPLSLPRNAPQPRRTPRQRNYFLGFVFFNYADCAMPSERGEPESSFFTLSVIMAITNFSNSA